MVGRPNPRAKWRIALAIIGAAILFNAGYVWLVIESDDSPDRRFIGYHPLAYKVHDGQTKAEVLALLGKLPQDIRPRHKREWDWPGPVPVRVEDEEWNFEFEGWHGGIIVSFDERGQVTYVGYGCA